jgi:uncharacterized membrane protein
LSTVPSQPEERFSRPGRPAPEPAGERRSAANWLLLVPILAVLFPWVYDTRNPELIGIPFFYWYQMLWVPLSAVFTILVYRLTRKAA